MGDRALGCGTRVILTLAPKLQSSHSFELKNFPVPYVTSPLAMPKLLLPILATGFSLLASAAPAASAAPPNIVFIMSDELAYYELGHMGNPYLKTPRIDQMATDGIRFTHALAASPVCAPQGNGSSPSIGPCCSTTTPPSVGG